MNVNVKAVFAVSQVYTYVNVKKLEFTHKLKASETCRTAKIQKSPTLRLNVNVLLLSSITSFFFLVFDSDQFACFSGSPLFTDF